MKNKIVQDPPFTMQIEPTEGCNLGCSFCGLHGMREKGTKPWNFMTVETAERIASEVARVGWNCKFVFAMHGEPTLNPAFIDIVATFRKHLPKAVFHMYSNGYAMNHAEDTEAYLDALFGAGMNDILVDCYTANGDWNFVEKIDVDKYNVVTLEPGVPYYYPKQGRRICLLPPIAHDDTNKMTRRLANHCGAAFPLDDSFNNKRCTFPFRELDVRWNGQVCLCCDDFRGEYPIANIHDMPIEDLWNHPRFHAARVMLYNNDRRFRPCQGCTHVSVRVGFLPDKMGKKTLPPITPEIRRMAEDVSKDGPCAEKIYKRPWEK